MGSKFCCTAALHLTLTFYKALETKCKRDAYWVKMNIFTFLHSILNLKWFTMSTMGTVALWLMTWSPLGLWLHQINLHRHSSMKDIWDKANCAFKPSTYKKCPCHYSLFLCNKSNKGSPAFSSEKKKKINPLLISAPFICVFMLRVPNLSFLTIQ